MKKIYLIPSPIADGYFQNIPPATVEQIRKIKFFVVERVRTSRRFIKGLIPDLDLGEIEFIQLEKKSDSHLDEIIPLLEKGIDIGILSESGIPGVADPGSTIVRLSTSNYGYQSSPLSGPSSIFMALSASGLNGQFFTFHGYLPVKENELSSKIKALGKAILQKDETQIFIETPYRNDRLLKYLLRNLPSKLMLCVARDITGNDELILTRSIEGWKRNHLTIGKSPTIFLVGK